MSHSLEDLKSHCVIFNFKENTSIKLTVKMLRFYHWNDASPRSDDDGDR